MTDTPISTLGRNDPCHCGSGKKYKKCHTDQDEAKKRAVTEKQWQESAKTTTKSEEKADEGNNTPSKHTPMNPQVSGHKRNTLAIPKFNTPRRTGGG